MQTGFYWVTDTSSRNHERTIVEVYEVRSGLKVAFLGSDMDDTLEHAQTYLTCWSGPLTDPQPPET